MLLASLWPSALGLRGFPLYVFSCIMKKSRILDLPELAYLAVLTKRRFLNQPDGFFYCFIFIYNIEIHISF